MLSTDLPGLARRTRDLLAAGVPLTLLLDLAEPAGPDSRELYVAEGIPAQWLPGRSWPAVGAPPRPR